MPRKSLRAKALDAMRFHLLKMKKDFLLREAMDEEDSVEEDLYLHQTKVFNEMSSRRYLYRKPHYRTDRIKFDLDDALSSTSKHYNDEEFLLAFRITRESFFLLLDELKDKKPFKKVTKKKPQRPIAFQLLVYLFRIGTEGNGGGSGRVASYFGIGKGSVDNYVKRCVSALMEIKKEVVYWPDENERMEMRNRLSLKGFHHCVGIIDGTLVQLTFRPESYHECYFSRKCMYALNVLIICDDKKRIIYYTAGWPGSTHDNRVFCNSKLFYNRGDYFSHHEYLLGDSAYSASPIMVQAFKKQASAAELPGNHEYFNTCLAQVRIASEHCIGILKGRFRCLKQNNIKLKNGKKEMKELVNLIGSCIVLHNLLINYEEEHMPTNWYDEITDEIDWGLYDEEEEVIAQVTTEKEDRRKFVYNSIINNYL